jgi:hypothetical protein
MGPRPVVGLALLFACGPQTTQTTTPSSDDAVTTSTPATTEDRSSSAKPDFAPFVWPTAEAKAPVLGKALEKGRPKGDRSRAFPEWETRWFSLGPPAKEPDGSALKGEVTGEVTAIEPAVGDKKGRVRIEAGESTAVELELAGPGRPPFAVGDVVAAKWRVERAGIHNVRHLAVAHVDGRLIYASSGGGDVAFAPGWYIESKGVRERDRADGRYARRESRWQLVALGDAAALVSESDAARRLETDAGEFAVHGSAISYSGGMRRPDSSAYSTFSIARIE